MAEGGCEAVAGAVGAQRGVGPPAPGQDDGASLDLPAVRRPDLETSVPSATIFSASKRVSMPIPRRPASSSRTLRTDAAWFVAG